MNKKNESKQTLNKTIRKSLKLPLPNQKVLSEYDNDIQVQYYLYCMWLNESVTEKNRRTNDYNLACLMGYKKIFGTIFDLLKLFVNNIVSHSITTKKNLFSALQ